MGSGHTITVRRVRAVLRGAERLGIDTRPLLQRAGIPPLLLGDDAEGVTPARFARLIQDLYRATGDEFLGLGAAPSRRGTFAMMCYAALGCADLGGALDRAVRFYGLFPGGPRLRLESEATGRTARYAVLSPLPHDPDHFLAESLLVIWHRTSSWLVGRRIPLLSTEFAYVRPPHHAEYEVMFGCRPRFGAEVTSAVFEAHWLRAPVVRDQAALDALLRRSPEDLLVRHTWDVTVSERVRHTLRQALREGTALPELGAVAARLAVSPATLRRRLDAEGTSFQRLKDAVRRDSALESLARGDEPIALLARRLGFSEDTAFHRAFRRWTGRTPGDVRGQSS
ncbi:AraC family transcriptional regulator [Streptomyces iconiensis]|uniref:AraC family transcriptional regulator n=1 Tax=Streptomyces iconiensis TaxID=1384038 RepID=A0ABT7A3C4_9ACTN|nr:AraC family transcriptional regulator [Streptomyces iconiensis]MDJ1135786.1 AraC family transcriptional regulator [Streptomyces iconiensis]